MQEGGGAEGDLAAAELPLRDGVQLGVQRREELVRGAAVAGRGVADEPADRRVGQ